MSINIKREMGAKALNTKENIVLAASREFVLKGYFGTTTQKIAQAAELSEGALFRYFSTKDAMADEVIKRALEALVGELEKIDENKEAKDIWETLFAVLKNCYTHQLDSFLFYESVSYEHFMKPETLTLQKTLFVNMERILQSILQKTKQNISWQSLSRTIFGALFQLARQTKILKKSVAEKDWKELKYILDKVVL
jgi:AcrR family transcriptional regulator